MYADDTVLLSETKHDLQYALSVFERYCNEWKLTVNTTKTKVLVFSSGKISKFDKFYLFGGNSRNSKRIQISGHPVC